LFRGVAQREKYLLHSETCPYGESDLLVTEIEGEIETQKRREEIMKGSNYFFVVLIPVIGISYSMFLESLDYIQKPALFDL
jgi:hypothetical protein